MDYSKEILESRKERNQGWKKREKDQHGQRDSRSLTYFPERNTVESVFFFDFEKQIYIS